MAYIVSFGIYEAVLWHLPVSVWQTIIPRLRTSVPALATQI